MAYKRAEWRSGLTYMATCDTCKTVMKYMDDKLDFRPWYADGFVYCPKCNSPVRHRESNAINGNPPVNNNVATPVSESMKAPAETQQSVNSTIRFCSNCGREFGANDKFCAGCGSPRK